MVEVRADLVKHHHMNGGEIDETIAKMDKDGDGTIDFTEFLQLMKGSRARPPNTDTHTHTHTRTHARTTHNSTTHNTHITTRTTRLTHPELPHTPSETERQRQRAYPDFDAPPPGSGNAARRQSSTTSPSLPQKRMTKRKARP